MTYTEARQAADTMARMLRIDVGIERVTMIGVGYRVFPLPRPENRRGHELRCEVVPFIAGAP